MGIALLIVIVGYLVVVVPLVLWMVKSLTGSNKAKWAALVLLLVGPFWRPLFCGLLFKIVVHEPLQEILQTVESPESVYWQDDVWPGFDAYGRKWMVEQYLDGVHLKALALNGDDGKIYLYRAAGEMFSEAENRGERMERLDPQAEDYPKLRAAYMRLKKAAVEQITNKAEIFKSASQLPPMRYRVHFMPLDNWWRERSIYHADQITITESATGKVIAFSRRYMAFSFWLTQFSGNQPEYLYGPGDKHAYEFDDKVLFEYAGVRHGLDLTKDALDRRSYQLIKP